MTKKLLFVVTILLVASFSLLAADVTGKWVAEQPGRNGGPPRQINLRSEGRWRQADRHHDRRRGTRRRAPTPIEITDGKVDGDKVSFTVKRETQNGPMETKYNGTVSGDELKLKFTMMDQEREITAKRSTT